MESLRLESLEQRVLLSAFVVNDTSDSGPGSLRQAILDANAAVGADVITFALGNGVVEIQPLTALPSITDTLTLDGTTQSGYAGSPLIWLDGSICTGAANGLTLDASDSLIRGLAITGFNLSGVAIHGQNDRVQDSFIGIDPTGATAGPNGANGIEVADASGALIQGNVISGNSLDGVLFTGVFSDGQVVDNLIGLDASGTHALANWGSGVHVGASQAGLPSVTVRGNVISSNFGDGVWLDGASGVVVAGNVIGADAAGAVNVDDLGGLLSNYGNGITVSGDGNTIGGPGAADRNIISGNFGDGVQIQAGAGNTVQGNSIGTTADGAAALPNYGNGVAVLASGNRIVGNVLSGNFGDGARVLADGNVLQGNFIGTAADGLGALGNNADGVWIDGSGNLVGGAQAGEGNIIAFNTGNGVTVAAGTGNAIRGNSIYANATGDPARPGIGIDLGNDGVTANDSLGHVGPNQFQNFPVLMDATRTGDTFTIDGALTGAPSTAYTVEFFSNVAADPSGYGQGQTYLGSLDVVTDAAGVATFQATLTAAVGAQNVVTATATDSAGNTSEFGLGQNVVVIVETTQDATATVVSSDVNPSVIGQPVTLTATVSDLVASYTPTGWVTFMDGAITLGSAGLSGGTASLTTWSLPVGSHTIVAVYNGDSTCEPSASGPYSQVVAQGVTVTTLASSLNPSTIGQSVTLSANVAFLDPADAVLTGSVTFMDGSAVLGTVNLTNGAASLTTAALTVGTHSITAVYNGDTNFAVSTSAPQSQVVNPLPASLSGYVFLDANNDGIRQASETGIAGVTVTLTGTDYLGATVLLAATTNAAGTYSFLQMRPGTYAVAEAQPAGYVDGKDAIGTQGGTAGNDVFSGVVLAGGVDGTENNFGELKNVVAGHTLRDMTGNGTSTDDVALPGVTVKLYLDRNGNGVLESSDGSAVATAVTDSAGAYSFLNLTPGAYLVSETVPSGYVRTIPYFSNYYLVDLSGTMGGTAFDFDNYKRCTGTVTNVSFTVNNSCQKVTDLRGKTHQGDTVKVTFTVSGTTPAYVTFVTYDAPSPVFDAAVASQQTIYQQVGGLYNPGTYTLTVSIPDNYYQIDFVKCHAIDRLGPAGSNIFYSAQSRLISADNAGTHSDVDDMAATTGFWAHLGQSLIRNFDVSTDGTGTTVLANWLAASFPNLYGSHSTKYNLTGKSNTDVASLMSTFYSTAARATDAQVLATALNVYASTASLGGDAAAAYGFSVSAAGLGAAQFNVLTNGSAFGVANNTTLSVWTLLQDTNLKSASGQLYDNVASLLAKAYTVYSQVNTAGGIS